MHVVIQEELPVQERQEDLVALGDQEWLQVQDNQDPAASRAGMD